ncbi:hypothetical protein Pmar_PMAR016075 [Perkinsus marinus ATCC 50983]|uniref:Uncharacterized protein n=1 Tax=Perkinsus marinus (strain ATCC 50983 / TXsc) TaxID=423536 RepID=C5LYZ1_PERM5|nr:hypothetical protein Pmar_PMAR016075 [Perkinsus marinus ATCC 50983]EEQ98000.1 hypothetical protein Pmar_PMAR016075 [Perkinsus marinus ATCC 50983]|eukprot:XP_002765283.1 hypothetical protein Pmar_PMAR016075 [Perkinsus marinus ATCC 50983]
MIAELFLRTTGISLLRHHYREHPPYGEADQRSAGLLGEVSNDDDEESISSMSSSEERDLMVSSTELQDSEPLHFSTIDGDDNTEGVDLTTISGGLPRIYHHTQIGQCLVDVLHDLMAEGKASLEDKEVALNILEEEFQLAFKNLYPGVLDNNSKGRGKGSKKRKRKGKHNSAEQGEGFVDQDILSILRDDPLFSREDRGSSTHQLQRSDGVHAQRGQTTQMALDRGATTMSGYIDASQYEVGHGSLLVGLMKWVLSGMPISVLCLELHTDSEILRIRVDPEELQTYDKLCYSIWMRMTVMGPTHDGHHDDEFCLLNDLALPDAAAFTEAKGTIFNSVALLDLCIDVDGGSYSKISTT